jgi:23S rRNA pseudouridine1911/1915/1917 synthase
MKITVEMPEITLSETPAAEEFDFPILFENDQMLVIDKPAGVVVHPAAGNTEGTVVNALLGRYPTLAEGFSDNSRPGIVHRLDKDTSGCLIVAKTPEAQFALGKSFADREVSKTYLTIVCGIPARPSGEIITLIGRHPVNRQKMAVVPVNGRRAITHWKRLAKLPNGLSRVLCRIETGRTHQIRVHMASCGTPIVGDVLYGKPALDHRLPHPPTRQLLHAYHLELPHPITGERLSFTAEPPADFTPYLDS